MAVGNVACASEREKKERQYVAAGVNFFGATKELSRRFVCTCATIFLSVVTKLIFLYNFNVPPAREKNILIEASYFEPFFSAQSMET